MSDPRYPALYQINTCVWLTALSHALGKRATPDDLPDPELERLAEMGFDWGWFLSVLQTGPAAQALSCRTSNGLPDAARLTAPRLPTVRTVWRSATTGTLLLGQGCGCYGLCTHSPQLCRIPEGPGVEWGGAGVVSKPSLVPAS